MAGLLERIRRAGRKPFHAMTPDEARTAYVAGAEVLEPPRRPLARVQDFVLPGGDGTRCQARLYAASNERLPVMLYLHGGGFVVGGLETHDALCRQLAARSGWAIVALDYRLAPEHPFPAAQGDAWAALRALPAMADALGVDAERLAVGGDSAGGTLAAAVALALRGSTVRLALQLLFYPATDMAHDLPSHQRLAEGYALTRTSLLWFRANYLGSPANERDIADWRASPLRAAELAGLPPASIVTAGFDPLLDEGRTYAERLHAAGVPVRYECFNGMIHGFLLMTRELAAGRHAIHRAGGALREAFAGRFNALTR